MSLSILIVSYRDICHPEMGGAEVIIHEVYSRLAARGHKVTFLTGRWRGAPAEDSIDGMEVIRTGSTYTFNRRVPGMWRRLRARGFDLMVEDLNKIPFFGPSFQKDVPVLANVPHLFGTTVFREASWPIALYVYLHERFIPSVYRDCRFQVLSDTTRDDLVSRGIAQEKVHVVRAGIDHGFYRPPRRSAPPGPVVLYLGRLKRYKGIDLVVDAMPRIRERVPSAVFRIAGEGDYRPDLEARIRRTGLQDCVSLLGHQEGTEKLAVMNEARVLVYPSPKEGWGLSVIEGNAMGIPAVASDSPGLRESVRNGETGFLVPHGDVAALAARVAELLCDDALWVRMGQAGIRWASRFNWGAMADETEELLVRVVGEWRRRGGNGGRR